jgi:hypothetical protein
MANMVMEMNLRNMGVINRFDVRKPLALVAGGFFVWEMDEEGSRLARAFMFLVSVS